ncbi:MAG: Crp/Fnr family transcriptional regulator [Candidatus Geothermincolia bacterium]
MERAKGGTQVATKCDYLDEFVSHAKKNLREGLKEKFTRLGLDRGQFVFFEGDPAAALYLVESGVIEANVIHGDGKVYIFHFIFPGEVFGEGVVYGQDFFPFSTVTRKEASIFKITREDLMPVLNADPEFERHILQMVGRKLDSSYIKARCIAGERVERRVACILLKTLDENEGIRNCRERIDSPLTNRDISGLIGSTEETVSRVMSRLKKEGIVGTQDKQLVVLDRDALVQYFESM